MKTDSNITIGLDGPTLKTIDSFPANVRSEIVNLLKEALPLLKKDVREYLREVDAIAERQIINAQCAIMGPISAFPETINKMVWGKDPMPIEDLRAARLRNVKPVGASGEPQQFVDKYSGLSYMANVTYCRVKVAPTTAADALEVDRAYRRLHSAWKRLVGECRGVENCLDVAEQQTQEFIKRSDKRDVDLVHGSERFEAVQRPPRLTIYDRIGGFDPTTHEAALLAFLSIGDEIGVARYRREQEAAGLFSKALAQLGQAADLLDIGQQVPAKLESSIRDAEMLCTQADENIKSATGLDSNLRKESEQRLDEVRRVRVRIDRIKVSRQ